MVIGQVRSAEPNQNPPSTIGTNFQGLIQTGPESLAIPAHLQTVMSVLMSGRAYALASQHM